ncbi:MAG: AraC family transcriptional regulator [Mucilaginibacter sp.]|nr:AraC family transcriptional regulator [Mucilaginibacter sp.]
MSAFVELQAFYKNINRASEPVQNGIGHFNIFKIEDILLPKSKQANYSRRSFYKVSLITGHNKLHYADKCIEITESALVFTNPTIPYKWERISEKQTGYFCIFTEPFFSRFGNIKDYPVFQYPDAAIIPLAVDEVCQYNDLFIRMLNELQSDYIYKYDLLRNLLMEMVHSAQKRQPAHDNILAGSNASERITALFAELLERQFPIELNYQVIKLNSPSAFAGQLNIHVNHLNKALKEITGKTTSQLINERLLQEAKILLKSTNWTISEIAWSLGFEEPNHFSSFFKNRGKTTPKKFRQLIID